MKKREKWFVTAKRADFNAIGARFGIDPVTARLIRNRDVIGMEAVQEYLHGSLSSLHDAHLLKGCDAAADLLLDKIQGGKKIRIIGDYDIDGVNSTYILYRALTACGAAVDYEIPDRMKDGYGLNIHLIELAVQEGVDTILTCDNGIAAIPEIAYAKKQGMTVIVTDHHEPLFVAEEAGAGTAAATEAPAVPGDCDRAACAETARPGNAACAETARPGNAACAEMARPGNAACAETARPGNAACAEMARPGSPLCSESSQEDCAAAAEVASEAAPDPAFRVSTPERTFRLPPADVIVNPKQPLCSYPYKKLCGAVVAWKLVCVLYERTGHSRAEMEEFLPFAAFATIGDVMDLDGENRIIVKEGLARLHVTANPGLCALIAANGLDQRSIGSYHIGFVLGPCINASGRLDTAKRSLRLLLSESRAEADEIARQLKELNDTRKAMTEQAVKEACARMEADVSYQEDRVLVLYLPECHESIAGIVAGRLRERYYKPVFVVTDSGELAKGSGRSIEAYSMFEEMVRCQDLFVKFGGHPMAAGFSLEKSRVPEMRRRLNENCTLTPDDLTEKIHIDVPMPVDYITEQRIAELSLLEPFGKGNEKPLFAESGLTVLSARILGKNKNVLKFRLLNRAGCPIDALCFGGADEMQRYLTEKYGAAEVQKMFWGRSSAVKLDVTYYPSVNEYMGRRSLQIVIQNYR